MKLLYVTDQRFYRCQGDWYTTASFPMEEFWHRLGVTDWTFWGRLSEVADGSRLFALQAPAGCEGRLHLEGPYDQPAGPMGYLRSLRRVRKALKRLVRQADVVWLKMAYVYSSLAVRYCTGRQVVVSQQVGDPVWGVAAAYPKWKLLGWVHARNCRRVAARADVPSFVSRDVAHRYGGGRSDLVISNESRVRQSMLRPPRQRPGGSSLEVIFVGRLTPEKRVCDLIRAVDRVPQARLSIVGDGPERASLQALAEELSCRDRIRWFGLVPWGQRLLELIRAADVLALVSTTEGMPLVLIEAMSQGTPVLATRVGGVPELVTDGVSGLLVDPRRPEQIADALERLRSDPGLWQRLAGGGYAVASQNTVERQLLPLLDSVRQCCQRKGLL